MPPWLQRLRARRQQAGVPARGRRVNKVGAIIAGIAVAMVLGGLLYMAWLSWTKPPPKIGSDKEHHEKHTQKMRLDAFRAPPDTDADKPVKQDVPRPKQDDAPPPKNDQLPSGKNGPTRSISTEEAAKREAAATAWKKYYETKAKLEEVRVASLANGMNSLWKGGTPTQDTGGASASGQSGDASASLASTGGSGQFASDEDKIAWANRSGSASPHYISGYRLPMVSPYQVMESTPIAARTEGGIFSGIPIGVRAKISKNVYCSVPGGMSRDICIPMGTTVVIDYNTKYAHGECVLQAAAKRIIYEDNSSSMLDNIPIGTAQGYGGMKDECDRHLTERLFNAVLFGTIDAAFETLGPAALGAENVSSSRQVERVAQGETQRNMQIPPTVRIRQGYDFTIVPHGDIIFDAPFEPMTEAMQ